jgi:hypothetical protein
MQCLFRAYYTTGFSNTIELMPQISRWLLVSLCRKQFASQFWKVNLLKATLRAKRDMGLILVTARKWWSNLNAVPFNFVGTVHV